MGWRMCGMAFGGLSDGVRWDDWRLVWVLSENVVQLRQMYVI